MEIIISSLKGPNGFKFILAFLIGLLLPILPSCEKNPSVQDPLISPSASASVVKITYGKVKDIEGNVYKTVIIGTQNWMAENLRTKKFNDGTSIPLVRSNAGWPYDTKWPVLYAPAYCLYDYNATNKTTYGALYNWNAVNTGKLCPSGWHVPSDAEWTTLTTYLGEDVAGDKLREAGKRYWWNNFIETNPTNETGFTALPGGSRIVYNDFTKEYFSGLNLEGYWWTSTPVEETENPYLAWLRYMAGNRSYVERWTQNKNQANSIRCIKNN